MAEAYTVQRDVQAENTEQVKVEGLSDAPSRKRYLDSEPIEINGEPLSQTILRERGEY